MHNQDKAPGSSERQRWNADQYQTHTGFVSTLGAPVVDLLAPKPGERILDLGCGDGVLTEKLLVSGADVTGVDASADMIEAAKAKGLKVRKLDAERLDFSNEFDAVFSNAALHWMLDPDAVIAGVVRALKPEGRFVGEFGGHGNVAAITVALIATLDKRGIDSAGALPWYFPTPTAYRAKLEDHGFVVETIDLIPRPTPLPTDMAGWLRTMAGPFLAALPSAEREDAIDDVLNLLRPSLCDDQGHWTADYVRLRFAASLKKSSR
ncbi:MAG: class I SAM-dependent methyltransferase [Geminicoccaceae bacterium]